MQTLTNANDRYVGMGQPLVVLWATDNYDLSAHLFNDIVAMPGHLRSPRLPTHALCSAHASQGVSGVCRHVRHAPSSTDRACGATRGFGSYDTAWGRD
eukprot:38468-Rhodomonas_salina.4